MLLNQGALLGNALWKDENAFVGGVKHKRRPMKKSTFLECTFVMGQRFLRFVALSVDLVSF